AGGGPGAGYGIRNSVWHGPAFSVGVFSVGGRGLLAYVGDLEFCAVAAGFDIDGDRILLGAGHHVGDDAAAIAIGRCHGCRWELGLIKGADLVGRVATLEVGGDRMHASDGDRSCAVFLHLRAGVDLDAQLADGLIGIVGAEGAEWRIDFYLAAFLGYMRGFGDVVSDEDDRGNAENSDAHDYGDDDQNYFERAATACRRGSNWRRCRGGGGASGNGCAALVAKFCVRAEGRATGIAECHISPRKGDVFSSTREYNAD